MDLQYYQDALAGKKPPIDADSPQQGYYKMRAHKGGPWLPTVIWLAGGELKARVGNEMRDPLQIWTFVAGNPVKKEDAKHAFEHGSWPGDVPAADGVRSIDDNAGPQGPLDLLRNYIETAKSWFSSAKIDDQKSLDTAGNYTAELTRLKGLADRERDSKVRPHLDAQREINGEYNPSIKEADDLNKQIKRACDDFMRAEKRRLEEEARKKYEAEKAAAEAERKRLEDERAKLMDEDPIAALTSDEPELPPLPPPPEPIKVQAGGQRGRKMSLRKYTVYEVTDYPKALAWASGHPEVVEAVNKVCTAAARAGEAVPGVTTKVEERAA